MPGKAFLQAAKEGDAAALHRMLDAEGAALLEFRGAGTLDAVSGNTAAHWAASRGHTAALEVLLGAGAPVGAVNHGGSTALQTAVLNGHAQAVRVLRAHGADPAAPDEFGDSALDLAQRSKRGREAVLAALTESASPPGTTSGAPSSTAGGAEAVAHPPSSESRALGNAAFGRQEFRLALELYAVALREHGGDAEVEGALW